MIHSIGAHQSDFLWSSTLWAMAFAIVLGVPTDLIDTPLFSRMTAAGWLDYSLWVVTSALGGLAMGARRLPGAASCPVGKPVVGAEALSFFAVACPVCNKLIVLLIGTSGALTYFDPIQPLLGGASVVVLAFVVRRSFLLAARGSARVVPRSQL